jgi:hypothetical protein
LKEAVYVVRSNFDFYRLDSLVAADSSSLPQPSARGALNIEGAN